MEKRRREKNRSIYRLKTVNIEKRGFLTLSQKFYIYIYIDDKFEVWVKYWGGERKRENDENKQTLTNVSCKRNAIKNRLVCEINWSSFQSKISIEIFNLNANYTHHSDSANFTYTSFLKTKMTEPNWFAAAFSTVWYFCCFVYRFIVLVV